jgi:hypothetical protein
MPNALSAIVTQCILGGFAPGTHKCLPVTHPFGVEAAVMPGVRPTPDATATPTHAQANNQQQQQPRQQQQHFLRVLHSLGISFRRPSIFY